MPNEKLYCFTCKRWISPGWWERHMASERHRNCVLGIPPPAYSWKTGKPADEDQPEDEPTAVQDDSFDGEQDADTRTPCGGGSRRITPGSEYWRSDGKAYHNGCVSLATTRPLNPPQTAQAAQRQAGKRVAGTGVQLGAGRAQNG